MPIASLPLRRLLLVVAALAVGVVGMQTLSSPDAPLAARLMSRAAAAVGMGGPEPSLAVAAAPSVSVAPGGAAERISGADPLH